MIIVDNNEAGEDIFLKVYKRIRGLVKNPPKSRQAKAWIANELKKKSRTWLSTRNVVYSKESKM